MRTVCLKFLLHRYCDIPRYSERLALFEGMKGFPYVTQIRE